MIRRRRLRVSENIRAMVQENSLRIAELVYPIFVIDGDDKKNPINSMPGIYQYSIDRLGEELERVRACGIKSVLLFGIPEHKDEIGSEAYNKEGIIQRAIRHIKANYRELTVIADICLCEYTDHGHCGIVRNGQVINDDTLLLLSKAAVTCVMAGADIIAPSDMMDGHVEAIRRALDEEGFVNTPIMAYSAKFASGYYAPFREAAHSAPGFGDRKTYQMDYANGREAVREIEDDIREGADIIMVKPALAYLDVVQSAAQTGYPVAVYNVSGEYAMVKAAAALGYLDERKVVLENLMAMKRAGANIIITYHALDAARWLSE